ncbi:MAG: hypothetical protein O3A00_15365, partial [Planctomycetota bacterium]|nr:hypothetical protein [Planctomycetota bacterium]
KSPDWHTPPLFHGFPSNGTIAPVERDLKGIRSFCAQEKYSATLGLILTIDEFRIIDARTVAVPAYALLSIR